MNDSTVKSKCFRIVKGYKYFNYNIIGVGKFNGLIDDLIKDISDSGLPYLESNSWTKVGSYGISSKNIEQQFRNQTKLAKIINKYRGEIK